MAQPRYTAGLANTVAILDQRWPPKHKGHADLSALPAKYFNANNLLITICPVLFHVFCIKFFYSDWGWTEKFHPNCTISGKMSEADFKRFSGLEGGISHPQQSI